MEHSKNIIIIINCINVCYLSHYTDQENIDEVIVEVNSNSEHMVLSNTIDDSVTEETFVEDESEQLWIKGIPDTEGYFTLRNKEGKSFLTPNTETNIFETKGM